MIIPDKINGLQIPLQPLPINLLVAHRRSHGNLAEFRAAGIPGAIGVTLALALPSFIIICIISKILTKFASNKYVNGAFTGMRPAVPALILAAVIPLFVVSVSNTGAFDLSSISAFFASIDYIALAVFGTVLIGFSIFKKWHPLIFIAFGAVVGIIFKL